MIEEQTNTKKEKTLTKADLTNFTGTENWYRYSMNKNYLYTDGVKYMAEQGGAYWLIDDILLHQHIPAIAKEHFQFWTLKVDDDRKAVLRCDDGNGNIIWKQEIPFTDFPLPEIRLYFTDNVLLLPSEY